MTDPLPTDLTRWNRAGLARVQYVDGNAAVFLERMRSLLSASFPNWSAAAAQVPADASAGARKAALEALYARDPDDLLWHLTRSHARAAHILAATLDAYANEGWIGTATQWESLRRLVAMLDYAPHPPSSAAAPIALLMAEGAAGKVAAGLQLRYTPADGSPPLVFETLDDLDADAACNCLLASGHDRNPLPLSGTAFELAGKLGDLKIGDPLVLEHERSGAISAHVLTSVIAGTDAGGAATTTIAVAPPLARTAGFTRGDTVFHGVPKDSLAPRGPTVSSAQIGRALALAGTSADLAAGEIVAIGRIGAKPAYRRIRRVEPGTLVFHLPVGNVDLVHATIARPIAVPVSRRLGGRGRGNDGRAVQALQVAGDWQWLLGQWLSDIRVVNGVEVLPLYECIRAGYVPVAGGKSADEGFTTITLAWWSRTDGVTGPAGSEPSIDLANTQALLAPPRAAGPVRPDTFLQQSDAGAVNDPLVTASPKKTSAGDFAVLQRGHHLAWARLAGVAIDAAANSAQLIAAGGWHGRGGGPFLLARSVVRSHFTLQARLLDWQANATPLAGSVVGLEQCPAALREGARVIVDNGTTAVQTQVAQACPAATPPRVTLRDPVPAGTTVANFRLWANVVDAGHGQARDPRILGSGDSTLSGQAFVLAVSDLSFVADATMPAGVRADVQVSIAGERWTQVPRLNDAASTDASYQVRQREDGTLLLQFGDGTHGRRLPTGANNVQVSFRQGNGSAGNLPANQLAKLARPVPLVKAVAQPIALAGGGEREAADAMRTNAAGALLALERAVTLEDFARLARSQAKVAQAAAFALPPGRGQRENIELRVIPAGGAVFTASFGQDIHDYLIAHAMPGVQVAVKPYTPLVIGLSAVVRVRLEAFDGDTVAAAVRNALGAAFGIAQRRLGQPLFIGAVTAVVEGVAGVENSDCLIRVDAATQALAERVSIDADGDVVAIRPWPQQCVHLATVLPRIDVGVVPFQL